VELRWASEKPEQLKDVSADNIYTIIEGQGTKDTTPLAPEGK